MGKLQAQQAALAQTNMQITNYADTLERLAISRERNRLGRELHDTLAHTLSGLTVQLETMKAGWNVKPETAYKLLEQSLATSRQGLDETRRALKALRAGPLEDLGLLLALRELCQSAVERSHLKLELHLPDQVSGMPSNMEQCVYRIAQEASENVLQHANATQLVVRLMLDNHRVFLSIQDDGMGFDVEQAEKSGRFGLPGMHERAPPTLAADERPLPRLPPIARLGTGCQGQAWRLPNRNVVVSLPFISVAHRSGQGKLMNMLLQSLSICV